MKKSIDDDRLEWHIVQFRTFEFVMILSLTKLANLIFENETDFSLIVDSEIVLPIEIAHSDYIKELTLLDLHDEGVLNGNHVESDFSSSVEEIVSKKNRVFNICIL